MGHTPNIPSSSKLEKVSISLGLQVIPLYCLVNYIDDHFFLFAVSGVVLVEPHQFVMEENEAYEDHAHHPQTGLNDAVECKEEEKYDYVVNGLVYELPS